MRSHGVRSTYTLGGCRCDDCKAAHNAYNRRYFARRRATVAAVERVRFLCDRAEHGDGIVLYPGHSAFKTVDLGLLRHALRPDCTCAWTDTDVDWDDGCPVLTEQRADA